MAARRPGTEQALEPEGGGRFPDELMYAAASLYYHEDATQADIAGRLGVSRPTVSRLLAEARRVGIVEITVHRPESDQGGALAARIADALGLSRVYLVPPVQGGNVGRWLAPGVVRALSDAALQADDILLVSSGLTLYQAIQQDLPRLPGVVVAPTVGGQEEPEPWYQTNLLATQLADRIGGRPAYLYAPALPSPALHRSLLREPSFLRVQEMWDSAAGALLGVGTAPASRTVIPAFVPTDSGSLRRAVGDVCARFYDARGRPVGYAGSDRLVAISVEALRRIPASIAVAAGPAKVPSIVAAARSGYFNRLVTDQPTGSALLTATGSVP